MEKIYQLHLELQTDEEQLEILRKYGKVEEGITRDVLVPGNVPLFALHFIIQKCFGWQNEHLHHFQFPDSIFNQLTEDSLYNWRELCGLYFRFPYYEEKESVHDIYWYNKYEDQDHHYLRYFKHLYNPPYHYEGKLENYLACRTYVEEELQDQKVTDISMEKALPFYNYNLWELLERLTIEEIFTITFQEVDQEKVSKLSSEVRNRYHELKDEAFLIIKRMEELKIKNISTGRRLSKRENDAAIYMIVRYMEILEELNYKVLPISKELIYRYHYSDAWNVFVSLEEIYEYEEGKIINHRGKEVESEEILNVAETKKPLCIHMDGLNVLEDVGGVYGYCRLLEKLHSKDEDKNEYKSWARSQGWTSRMCKAKNVL